MHCPGIVRTVAALGCFAAASSVAWAQGWTLKDAGVGVLDDEQRPPRIVERDRSEWFIEDIDARLGGRRYFSFWIAGPLPRANVNRYGTPIYNYLFRQTRPDGSVTENGPYGFSDEGWGTSQITHQPGNHRIEVFLLDRDTYARTLVKAFSYRVNPGKGGSVQPPTSQPPTPQLPAQLPTQPTQLPKPEIRTEGHGQIPGRVWRVIEGDPSWKGVWTRRGDSNIFDAVITRDYGNEVQKEVMVMEIRGNLVLIKRGNTPQNHVYTGALSCDRRSAVGNASWYFTGTFWQATIE